ncbi:MAG TPA: hypothetical protein VKB35_15990, partial [Ktedonobacteraceae bacterium]|nr:hypothetical protein [Ktedonobacteraceae bacterium]
VDHITLRLSSAGLLTAESHPAFSSICKRRWQSSTRCTGFHLLLEPRVAFAAGLACDCPSAGGGARSCADREQDEQCDQSRYPEDDALCT